MGTAKYIILINSIGFANHLAYFVVAGHIRSLPTTATDPSGLITPPFGFTEY